MSTTTSTYMGLPIPGVGTEPGPDYATDINTSLTLIDAHDHTQGAGQQITPDAININASLDFQNNFAIGVNGVTLVAQNDDPDPNTIFQSDVDLYFVDGLGNSIQITANGAVAGTPGSIANLVSPASAAYVEAGSKFVWESDSNIAADMDCGSILMRNLTPNSTYALTLAPPALLSSNYSITLPALPASTSFMLINSSGTVSTLVQSGGITGAMITAGTITNTNIAAGTIVNTLFSAGAQIPVRTVSKTTTYTAVATDGLILGSTSGGGWTLTLYSAASNSGLVLRIQKTSSDLNTLNIAAAGGESINGESSTTLNTQYEEITLVSDGSEWVIISRTGNNTLPVAYTPTFNSSWGSTSARSIFSWREGKNLCIAGSFTAGTTTGANLSLITIGFNGSSAPSGLSVDTTVVQAVPNFMIGTWGTGNNGGSFGYVVCENTNPTKFGFTQAAGSAVANTITTPNIMGGTSVTIQFNCRIPILGWKQ